MLTWIREKTEKHFIMLAKRLPVVLPTPVLPTLDELSDSDFENIQTVAAFIGPYRNLTTLIAMLLYFHANIHVLNHADAWVLDYPNYNFFMKPSQEKWRNFVSFALTSQHKEKNDIWHRHITNSHALRDPAYAIPRYLLRWRYGRHIKKPDIRSIVWKGALNTSNFLREKRVEIDGLFAAYPKLRFLLPVRHPLECARSNFTIQNKRVTIEAASIEEALGEVMELFAWGLKLKDEHPDRIFALFQQDMNKQTLSKLADFLEVPADNRWIKDVMRIYRLNPPRQHDEALMELYRKLVDEKLGWSDHYKQRMLEFVV
jgi:hypothetical protein